MTAYSVRDAFRDEMAENPIPRWRLLLELLLFCGVLFGIVVGLGVFFGMGGQG